MIREATFEGKYTHLWMKYKPVIVKLMVDAQQGPQSYQFQRHEFADLNNQKPTGYTFSLEVFENKKQNNPNSSLATDLLSIIRSSGKSEELTSEHTYLFQMDKNFVLEVKRAD